MSLSKPFKPELHTDKKILCACGCGQLIPELDKKFRQRKYIEGHSTKGKKRPDAVAILRSYRYNKWRKAVYKRDHLTCQICKKKQKHPIAHHIKSFNDYVELRFEVNNGITLCRPCHKKVHKDIGILTRF